VSQDFQSPKGTRDFYPPEQFLQNYIFEKWRTIAKLFGFVEYEGPIFEHLELFTKKSGDEIVKQLYNFTDKAERHLALRPEITPTLARMVNKLGSSVKYPLRWFSIPRLFRYEKMQKGRLREFYQLNLDIIGADSVLADAEIIASAAAILKSFGLSASDFSIRISSRKLLQNLLESIGIGKEKYNQVLFTMDRQAKLPKEDFLRIMKEHGLTDEQMRLLDDLGSIKTIAELTSRFGNLDARIISQMTDLFSLIKNYGIEDVCAFDLKIVRGLAYYTGIVFEVYYCGENLRAIAGGGRYDNLLESLGGKPCSCTGFGIGDVVLAEILQQKNLLPSFSPSITCYLVMLGEKAKEKAIAIATLLRNQKITVEFSLKEENATKQIRRANELHSKYTLILGDEEISKNEIRIKTMNTGEEKNIPESELLKFLSQ
jgi:histidyl-tRNA synthetase